MIVCSSVPTELHPQSDASKKEKELCMKDSRRLGLPRREHSRVLGSRSSSSKTHREVLLLGAPGKWCEKRTKVPPSDNPGPPNIWKQMRSTESLVEKEEPEF